MAVEFPFCAKQVIRGCVHFQENDIYHMMMESMEGSIRIIAQCRTQVEGGSIREVLNFLTATFGFQPREYKYWRCSLSTFRIELPYALNRQLMIEEGNTWGLVAGWAFLAWDTTWDARIQPKKIRVRVRIASFSEEFWHPFFRDIESTDAVNIRGENYMNLCIWTRCVDPKCIPYYTTLPYGCSWKECTITVVAWEYVGDIPPGDD